MKKIISLMLALIIVLSLMTTAYAEGGVSCAVIGADLSAEQIDNVYSTFGISQGEVNELVLTNAEERALLSGFVDEALIGTKSISCVYVELLPEGSGISVSTSNISWCTGEMYVNALTTAGVSDARIVVSAPFEVSGTSALAGIYKAYESMTGTAIDDTAKLVSTQELSITGELADAIGSVDSTSIVNELKLILDQTKNMSDEEIRAVIDEISSRYNVSLTGTQYEQLISLCRALEKLDPDSLKARVEEVQETIQKVSDAKDKMVGFAEKVKTAADSVQSLFDKIMKLVEPFFN